MLLILSQHGLRSRYGEDFAISIICQYYFQHQFPIGNFKINKSVFKYEKKLEAVSQLFDVSISNISSSFLILANLLSTKSSLFRPRSSFNQFTTANFFVASEITSLFPFQWSDPLGNIILNKDSFSNPIVCVLVF